MNKYLFIFYMKVYSHIFIMLFFQTDNDETLDTFSQASSRLTTQLQSGFKRPRSKAEQVLDKISKRIDQPVEKTAPKLQFASFGDHVAEKLRSMPPEMIPVCQKLIGDVLFYGEMQHLNMTSRIVTDYSPRPTEPPPSSNSSHVVPTENDSVMSAYYEAMRSIEQESIKNVT